ncbi:AraC family transcriptional regulator [Psychromonas ossibalaenae]|uniref:AraC family transcriptional regulator n=1 Tax=Psychromonas ossibalaenae TaxID=444922 RepID=UPI00035D7D16|nr:AraC family transcriptional regulator [Psychromonas ossibalaenae]
MCKNRQNLCKSVISKIKPKSQWQEDVYLADACKERFLTTSDIPELHQEQIFMAGMAELADGYHVERCGVAIHTLIFTLEGSGILTTAERVELIEPYTLLVIPAHMPFRFELNPVDNYWKMVWLLPQVSEKWKQFAELGQTILPYHQCEQIWSLLNLIHCEINGRTAFRRLLVSELNLKLTGVESKSTSSVSRVHTLFNEVQSQLHLPWTVKEMASQCFISEEQLNRISKNLYAMSPRTRLIHLRMEKAADLLQYREWTISMIAQRLGYKDPYNFTHRFRKYFGCSPSRYRKNILETHL